MQIKISESGSEVFDLSVKSSAGYHSLREADLTLPNFESDSFRDIGQTSHGTHSRGVFYFGVEEDANKVIYVGHDRIRADGKRILGGYAEFECE